MIVNRFVTHQKVLEAKRKKTIEQRRAQGYRGPVGAMKLSVEDTIWAFLEYWDELGQKGWIYRGIVEYPDLPFGGVYCFTKETGEKIREPKIRKTDDVLVDDLEYIEQEEEENFAFDLVSDKSKEELFNSDAATLNEVMLRQKQLMSDDPDKNSDIIDELEMSEKIEQTIKDRSQDEVRHQLYKTYETKNKGKHAVFNGKETKQFKEWLDTERSAYDPYYQEYIEETGLLPINREQETPEFKDWLKTREE